MRSLARLEVDGDFAAAASVDATFEGSSDDGMGCEDGFERDLGAMDTSVFVLSNAAFPL